MNTERPTRTGADLLDRFVAASQAVPDEAIPPRHSQQTPACLELTRLGEGRAAWTDAERKHVDQCQFCQKVEAMFQGHPDGGDTSTEPRAQDTKTQA
jgi:hypothetical protein